MLIARETLDEELRKQIIKLIERQSLYLELDKRYNIPTTISADICSNRRDIGEVSDFIAFAFLDVLDTNRIQYFYTKEEIDTYSKQKYSIQKVKLPIIFKNMVQVAIDQWIGTISAKKLIQLKEAQLIKYNENTQRTLQRITRGENKYYKIALNKKSISEIKEAFENGTYISDDITLNVPSDLISFVTKRNKSGIVDIVVNAPAIMDILDGYHRYISLSQVIRDNPDFDYPMEIRIVSFSEEKAKQFIYQKDQKTKMKQIDSAAMNQYSPANAVVTSLNTNPGSNLRGMITKTANIDPAFLAAIISFYYFNTPKKKYTVKETLDVTNDLQQKFNTLVTADTNWLDHEFTEKEIQTIMFCFYNGIDDPNKIRQMIDGTTDIDPQHFKLNQNSKVKRKLINELTERL